MMDDDDIDQRANYFPRRNPKFRLANDMAYLKWLRELKAKRDAEKKPKPKD